MSSKPIRHNALLAGMIFGGLTVAFLLRRRSGAREPALPNQAIYHFYAPLYDRLFGAMYTSARRRTADLLQVQPGERLLISGVGTGLDLPAVPAGVEVTGVDISADMLRQAARKPSQASVHLVEMDAQKLDLPAESFDAVLLSLIVSVAPDGQAVFTEAWQALKPGGRLVLFDKFVTGGQAISPLRRVVGSVIRMFGTDVNRRLEDVLRCAEHAEIEVHERMLFGQYHVLKMKKGGSTN